MSDLTLPTTTANVVIENPRVRRVANIIIGALAIIIPTTVAIDVAAPGFDLAVYTTPAMAGLLFLAGLFQLGVTTPNIPR